MIIKLNKKELDILHSILITDKEIEKSISFALYVNNKYEISIEEELIEDLLGFISSEANHEEDKKRKRNIDLLYDKIEEQLDKT